MATEVARGGSTTNQSAAATNEARVTAIGPTRPLFSVSSSPPPHPRFLSANGADGELYFVSLMGGLYRLEANP